ncbi:hypothetical protein K402DRAFT_460017, partial [Aulographum hederae CBS 113979]
MIGLSLRMDWARLDTLYGEKTGVDEHGKPGGSFERARCFSATAKTGIYGTAEFFGFYRDTNMIPGLKTKQNPDGGLYLAAKLFEQCWPCGDGINGVPCTGALVNSFLKGVVNEINADFGSLLPPVERMKRIYNAPSESPGYDETNPGPEELVDGRTSYFSWIDSGQPEMRNGRPPCPVYDIVLIGSPEHLHYEQYGAHYEQHDA